MNETINNLSKSIQNIRLAINQGIDQRIEKGENIDESDKLSDTSSLSDYEKAIQKLNASITSTDQQLIILYTYAKDKDAAENKPKPNISWTENENKEYNIEYGEFDKFGWVPTEPIQQDVTEKLWIRFASIIKGNNQAEYGIPIQMTGDVGPQGQQGQPGQDAVILTAVHRLVKLYNTSSDQPDVPEFKKDNSANSKFANNLSENRIYYVKDGIKVYVDDDNNSEWKLKYSSTNESVVWEIDVDINSKDDVVKVISDPVRKNIAVTGTEVTYATSDDGRTPPRDGWDVRSNVTLNENNPYLWSKTTTTYSDGFSQDTYLLINEVPTTITGIEIKYLGTTDFNKPNEKSDAWVDEMPLNSPVIWKKETTTYSNDIYNGENTKTTMVPIVKQGPSGVQFIGHVTSSNELPQLSYTDEFIGKIAMLVGADTYIWYGVDNPVLENCQQYNGQYWLNMGPIHMCDWDAKEGELGYIKNKPFKRDVVYNTLISGTPIQLSELPYKIEYSYGYFYGAWFVKSSDSNNGPLSIDQNLQLTTSVDNETVNVFIHYCKQLSSDLIEYEHGELITGAELKWKMQIGDLTFGKTYIVPIEGGISSWYELGIALFKAKSATMLEDKFEYICNNGSQYTCWGGLNLYYHDLLISRLIKTNPSTYKTIGGNVSAIAYESEIISSIYVERIIDGNNNDYNPTYGLTITGKNNKFIGRFSGSVVGIGNDISNSNTTPYIISIKGDSNIIRGKFSNNFSINGSGNIVNGVIGGTVDGNYNIIMSNKSSMNIQNSDYKIYCGGITSTGTIHAAHTQSIDASGFIDAQSGFFKR